MSDLALPTPTALGSTFSAYRASPIFSPEPLTPARLQILARRLRDELVGDVVRGVRVGLAGGDDGDAGLGRAGVLEAVDWRWMRTAVLLTPEGRESSEELGADDRADDDAEGAADGRLSLILELRYENVTFAALLIRNATSAGDEETAAAIPWSSHPPISGASSPDLDSTKFTHLPLLLLRAPAPLKPVLTDFLARTFDCRVSPLRLDTPALTSLWEGWLADTGGAQRKITGKDIALTLGFDLELGRPKNGGDTDKIQSDEAEADEPTTQGLRLLDVIVPGEEVGRFVRAGATDENDEQPFVSALGRYLDKHLAMNLAHPAVRIVRVACDGFVLSGGGRVKVFGPETDAEGEAAANLISRLVDQARG